MGEFQVFNQKLKAFVKFSQDEDGKTKITDVKQKNPLARFKGVPIKER